MFSSGYSRSFYQIRFKWQLCKGYKCCIIVQIIKSSGKVFVRVSLGVCFCLDVCILTCVNYIKRKKRKFHCFLQFAGVKFINRTKTNFPVSQFAVVNYKRGTKRNLWFSSKFTDVNCINRTITSCSVFVIVIGYGCKL